MAIRLSLAFACLLPIVAQAANNWAVPCHNGQCSYDISNSTHGGHVRASMSIHGSASAISDLTPAAGWTITHCDPTTAAQDIRAYCTGDACEHLYENGAVGTIVRLPENCTRMPFARIAAEFSHDNQTLPDAEVHKLRRRDDQRATVRGIILDTNWHQIDPKHHGIVNMFVQGTTGDQPLPEVAARFIEGRGYVPTVDIEENHKRGFFDKVKSEVSKALQAMSFNIDKSGSKTLDVDKTFNVLDKSKQCAPVAGNANRKIGVKVGVEAKAHAVVNYGVVASGSIVPPKIDDFGIYAGLDADLDGIVTLDAYAKTTADSGKILIFEVGLPGVDFPDILTLGPSFQVNAQAVATMEADLEMAVDLAYHIKGAKLFFPASHGTSSGTFGPSDSNVHLSANPAIKATGTLSAHIIPTVNFGVSALKNLANVGIALNLDTYAQGDLSLTESYQKGFGGCADIKTGFAVNAVANGDFLSLLKKGLTVNLFKKEYMLWQKCFGNTRRHSRDVLTRDTISPVPVSSLMARDDLNCDGQYSAGATRTPVTSGKVAAANIH